MISNNRIWRILFILFVLFMLALGIGCADKAKIEANKKTEHWETAKNYMAKGKFTEAVIELRNVVQLDPQDDIAWYEMGMAQMNLQKYKEAFDAFLKATHTNPNNLKAHLKIGQIFILAKKAAAARYQVDRLMKDAPENIQVLTLLANTQRLEADYDSAIDTLKKIASLYPDDVSTQLTLAHQYTMKGDLERADKANLKAASLNPSLKKMIWESDSSDAPYRSIPVLARYYETRGKWEQAEKMYLKIQETAGDKVAGLKELAVFYTRANDYDKALEALKQAYSIRDELNISMLTAQLHFDYGRIKDAESVVDDILNIYAGYVDANLLKGRIYLIKNEYKEAIKRFDRVISDAPRNAVAHYYRGITLMKDGNIKLARQALEEAVELNPTLTDARMRLAGLYLRYFEANNLSLARVQLDEVLKQVPNHREALMRQGDLETRAEDFNSAENIYKKVVQEYPDYANGHFKLGFFYYMTKRQNKALALFEKSVAMDPSQTRALTLIIDTHIRKRAFKKALQICREYEKKIDNHPYFTAIVENLKGRVYLAKKDFKKAQAHFEASVQRDLNNLSSHMALAQLYLRDKDVNQVISHFEETLKIHPKLMHGYIILGVSYARKGEIGKAEDCYRKALAIQDDFAPAANNLAWSLAEEGGGNVEEALAFARIAKEKLPKNPHVADTLGWVYYHLGYYGKAVIELEKSVTLLPNNPEYTYHLAKAYYENNQRDQAKGYFEKALKLNPNFAGADDARQTLKKYRSLDG